MAAYPATTLTFELNRLSASAAPTGFQSYLDDVGAANKWAGTSGLGLLGALNVKAGTVGLGLDLVLNRIVGTSGLSGRDALASFGTVFVPTQLAGLALWLDAGQITGATDNTAVATWQDKSSNAFNVVQATGAKQPIYHSTGALLTPSGKPVVQFDGVSASIENVTANVGTTDFTVFMVAAKTVASNTGWWWHAGSSGAAGLGFVTDASNIRTPVYRSVVVFTDGAATTSVHEVQSVTGSTASSAGLWVNGVSQTLTGSGAMTSSGLGITVGYVGATGLAADFAAVAVADFIIYNRVLSTVERQQVEAYLKAKHGTP